MMDENLEDIDIDDLDSDMGGDASQTVKHNFFWHLWQTCGALTSLFIFWIIVEVILSRIEHGCIGLF